MYKRILFGAITMWCCSNMSPALAQQAPECTDVEENAIMPAWAIFNFGGVTNAFSFLNKSSYSLGEPVVGGSVSSSYFSYAGFWARYLIPPFAPAVKASQGEYLDRIQITWVENQTGPLSANGYKLYRDGIFLVAVDQKTNSFNDFNVIAGRPYKYEVRGINLYGEGLSGEAIGFQVPNGTVTGWVQTASGRPVPDALVTLTPLQGFSADFGAADGAFAEADAGTAGSFMPASGSDWTLAFWVKSSGYDAGGQILSLSPFPLYLRTTPLMDGIEVGQDPGIALLSGQLPPDKLTDWNHVAITMDADGIGRLYLNGVLVSLGSLPPVLSADELSIGARASAAGFWEGRMDELRIYHRRLDELDLGEVMMGTASSQTPDLKYYWKMDEELGTGSFDVLRRNKLFFCGASFNADRPYVRTMGKTNQEGYYRIESASYGTGTTFLAQPMKDFYLYRSLKFTRDDEDYATFPDFSVTPRATLEMWVNSAGPDGEQCLLSKKWGSNDFRLLLKPVGLDNDLWFYINGQEHNFGSLGMGYQHLAFTLDTTLTDNELLVTAYKNGVSLGSHTFTGVTGDWSDTTTTWMLGARPSGGGRTDHFGGLIDEVALYDTTLNVASIIDHFQNPRDMQAKGLRVYFGLNEGSGNRLNNVGSLLLPFGTTFGTEWSPFASRQMTTPHVFSPNTRQVTLNPSVTSVDQVDFTDRSTVPVTGFIRYKNTDCFAKNVEILVNGASFSPKVFTDSTGKFTIDFDPGATAELRPVFEDHQFVPAFWDVTNVSSPIAGILFTDVTTRKVTGQVAGGLCRKSVIRAPAGTGSGTVCVVKVRSADGCLERQLVIDNQAGNYEFDELPPLESMTVAVVEHSDPDVKASFQVAGGATVDLSKNDTIIDFIYFAPPQVKVVNGLNYAPNCSPPVVLMDKGEIVVLDINLIEQYVPIVDNMNMVIDDGICMLDTANFRIINFIGEQVFDTVMSGGLLRYRFVVRNPNPSPPHLKSMQFVGTSVSGRSASLVIEAVVTGIRNKENTFTTMLPETPTLILRDPPGDGSYSFLEKDEKVCKTTVVTTDFEIGGGAGLELHLGGTVGFDIGVPPVTVNEEAGAIFDINAELQVTYQKITDSTFQTCTSLNSRLATNDGDLIVGGYQGGDIYMGEALNIIFGFGDKVTFDLTSCTASTTTILNVEPGNFATTFIYSEWYIETFVMSYLDSLAAIPNADPADVARYVESKTRWQAILDRNEGLKEKAKFIRNISFDAFTSYEYSETSDTTTAAGTEELVNSEGLIETHVGYQFNDFGFSGMLKFVTASSSGERDENGVEKGVTIGYVLADDDPGDAFTFDVAMDSVYKTPVFRLKAGQSSCPWEFGTAHREGNSLTFRDGSGALAVNVPAHEPAVFKFFFGNTSATNETWTYAFTAGPESNPHGAKLSINGSPMDVPIMYAIPWGTSIPVTVTLERGPEEYEYDSLELVLYSLCEDVRANALGILPDDDTILYSAQYVSAHFIRPCSEVDINVPEQNWVVINNDPIQPGAIRRITVSGYDESNPDFQLVRVQYRRADGDGAWINIKPEEGKAFELYNKNWSDFAGLAPPLKEDTLTPGFSQFFWDTEGLSDGPYEIHAWAVCTGDATDKPGFSEIIKGRIDREPPSIVGVPQPSDGVYHVGDEISFTFNQHINCDRLIPATRFPTLVKNNVGLYDGNTLIDISITCFENKIVIDPTFNNKEFENRILRIELDSIEDLIGNVFLGTKLNKGVWEFFVDRNELAWLTDSAGTTKYVDEPKSFTASIHNRGGYPVPYKILYVPDWVHVSPDQGTLVANEIRPITFTVDSTLAFGPWSDTIVLETQTGQNPFFMGGSEKLPLGVRVVCHPPYEGFNPDLFENSMTMVLKVNIEGEFSTDPEDMVAAFIDDQLRGRAYVQFIPQLNDYRALLFIYGDPSDMLKPIRLEVWDASQCERYGSTVEQFTFQPDNAIGTLSNPQVIHTAGLLLREVPFNYGWNWLSFNLAFPDNSLNAALASLHHPENDLMKGQTAFSEYMGGWFGTLNTLNNTSLYIYRADVADTLRMQGTPINPATTPIPVMAGWNWIGYIPNYALPINTALGSLSAQPGDVIKGQHAFSEYLNATHGWVGNLKYLSPPNGYQIRLSNAGTLTYPPKPAPLVGETVQARGETEPASAHWSVDPTRFEHSSTLIGMLRANGANATTSDMELGAFAGGEVRGTAQAIYIEALDAHLFFLTTYANTAGELLRFKLYNDADGSVRDLSETMYFSPNLHSGSIQNPVPFELLTTSTGENLVATLAFDAQPNPFATETTLRFNLPKAEEVTLTISDAQGREVARRPISAGAGPNALTWNGRSDTGSWLSSGVYTVRLQTEAGSVVRKVVLQRLP